VVDGSPLQSFEIYVTKFPAFVSPNMFPRAVVLQSGTVSNAVAVAGTVASLALFLSVTAHIAARNVLGDVPVRYAFVVGPLPAVVAVVFTTFGLNPFVGLTLALLLDFGAIRALYGRSNRLSAYVTLIHFVVTVILGAVLFGILTLASTIPT
jgi:hypothetical protein